MEVEDWGCSPHFPGVVHGPGEVTEVVVERRIASEAKCIKNQVGTKWLGLISMCLEMREKATARCYRG